MIIIGFILFVSLIIIHELGHFWAARRSGVEVEEFGIGFPPRAAGRKFKGSDTLFSINWLPLGGFVKLKGEHDADKEPGSYGATSFLNKTFIILAGIMMNFIAAWVILTGLSFTGMPRVIDNQFAVSSDTKLSETRIIAEFVVPESDAASAGLEGAEQILSINGVDLENSDQVYMVLTQNIGQTVEISYKKDGETRSFATQVEDIPPEGEVLDSVVVARVVEGSIAESAGIKEGDQLVSINGITLTSADSLVNLTEANLGQEVELVYQRNGELTTVNVQLPSERGESGILGVATADAIYEVGFHPVDLLIERSTWSAPIRGAGMTLQFGWLTLGGALSTLGQLFTGQGAQAAEGVTGPVGIVVILTTLASSGFDSLLLFIALISIALAVLNLLPIPALDGGRLFVSGLFKALKKPLSPELEERIHATGMAVLLVLIALITIVDVQRFF